MAVLTNEMCIAWSDSFLMLSNRRFYVELNKERSRWRKQKNGLSHGSVLAPTLFNIYTNDQPIHYGTRSFIYADNLCITAQYHSFKQVENTIEEALDNLTTYYKVNSLRGSKRHSILAMELSQRFQAAVQIVSNLPAPSIGGPIYRFLGMRTLRLAGAAAHKSW